MYYLLKMSKLRFISAISTEILLKPKSSASTALRCMSAAKPEDQITHTGQKWDSDDYRMSRFVDRPKHVNPNIAMSLIDEIAPKACKERVVSCDGGSGPTGHPKVYINLDKPGNHACGYCGLRFYLDHGHH